jgi:hypothetical protein
MTDVQQPPAPPPPTNPTAEAASRLEQLKSDPAWRQQFLSGSGPQVKQYNELSELVAKGEAEKVDAAIAGVLANAPFQDSGHLQNIAATKMFRELGINDATIKQTLLDHEMTQQEHDVVAKWKADRMRDSEYVKKWLSGEGEQAREMMLANIVLSSSIKKQVA